MQHSTITSKGQITIPVAMRNKFRLVTGSKIEFIPYGEYLIAIPINKSINDLKGALPKPAKSLSNEEINNVINERCDRT